MSMQTGEKKPLGTGPEGGLSDQDVAREETSVGDYSEMVVPAEARRSNFRMLLTFSSMQLVFGAVLVGYDARFQGLSLGRLALAMAIAVATMAIYCIGSANVGSTVGMTHAVTSRSIFGRYGSILVSILLVIDGMGFYLFTVVFMISIAEALFGTLPAVSLLTAILALVMIFNNYFGFTGLARFAMWVATPVMIVWGIYSLIKALTTVTSTELSTIPHVATPVSLFVVVGAMVGLSTWGNEPDVFRYAKAGKASWWNVPTIVIAYVGGAFVFPILGYLIAALSNKSDFSASLRYFANLTVFGAGGLLLVVLFINQWAVQDGNLYIAINGAQNMLASIPHWRRQYTVVGLGLVAFGLTFILPSLSNTFTIVTGIGSVTVPVASTIMAMDIFFVPRLFGLRRPMSRVATWSELAAANIPGIVALLAGTGVGLYTAGLIPFTSGYQNTYIGFPALQAWVTGAVVYLIGVAIIAKSANVRQWLGYTHIADTAPVGGMSEGVS
jgi:purine-cytosine permease-like protein